LPVELVTLVTKKVTAGPSFLNARGETVSRSWSPEIWRVIETGDLMLSRKGIDSGDVRRILRALHSQLDSSRAKDVRGGSDDS
jgi:hypothetical protein